jgi:hypothetical protein
MGIPVVPGQIVQLFEAPERAAALVSDLRSHGPESGARQGCIVEQGTHAELVALGGHYSVAPRIGRAAVALAMTALDYILCLARRTWELHPENLTRAF